MSGGESVSEVGSFPPEGGEDIGGDSVVVDQTSVVRVSRFLDGARACCRRSVAVFRDIVDKIIDIASVSGRASGSEGTAGAGGAGAGGVAEAGAVVVLRHVALHCCHCRWCCTANLFYATDSAAAVAAATCGGAGGGAGGNVALRGLDGGAASCTYEHRDTRAVIVGQPRQRKESEYYIYVCKSGLKVTRPAQNLPAHGLKTSSILWYSTGLRPHICWSREHRDCWNVTQWYFKYYQTRSLPFVAHFARCRWEE